MPTRKRQGPRLPLIPLHHGAALAAKIDHLEETAKEQILALVPFVADLRATFARQWPAHGVNQGRPAHFTRAWPFPSAGHCIPNCDGVRISG
jgi:hypothetical protein